MTSCSSLSSLHSSAKPKLSFGSFHRNFRFQNTSYFDCNLQRDLRFQNNPLTLVCFLFQLFLCEFFHFTCKHVPFFLILFFHFKFHYALVKSDIDIQLLQFKRRKKEEDLVRFLVPHVQTTSFFTFFFFSDFFHFKLNWNFHLSPLIYLRIAFFIFPCDHFT